MQNNEQTLLFYHSQEYTQLHIKNIYAIIVIMQKQYPHIQYKFYNVPFCIFKKMGEHFVQKMCVYNKLCNTYPEYTHDNTCYRCKYALFCNNIPKNLDANDRLLIEPYVEDETISRDEILKKIDMVLEVLEKM